MARFRRKYFLKENRGFSLIELVVALGGIVFLVSVYSALNLINLNSEIQSRANLDALIQQSTIRDYLLTTPGPTAASCMSRLGLTGSEIFLTTAQFDIPTANIAPAESKIQIDRVYLDQHSLVSNTGTVANYNSILKIQQSVRDSTFGFKPIPPATLGSMRIMVDGSNHIIGCSWDGNGLNALAFCNSLDGTDNVGSAILVNCNVDLLNPGVVGPCPSYTTMDLVTNRCVPSNIYCKIRNAGDNFDGNGFSCSALPNNYAIRYPAGYSAPALPLVPTACMCGATSMPPGGPALCVRATTDPLAGGINYDLYEIKVCNSLGNLESSQPSGYFDAMGTGTIWAWQVSTCTATGGPKYYKGKLYTNGRCI